MISINIKSFTENKSELELNRKSSEQDRKAIEELVRERDILNKVRLFIIFYPLFTLYLNIFFINSD